MKDRIPKYPGRVRLVPVPGKENTYDMIRADEAEQIGTPLIKANLLSDVAVNAIHFTPEATPSNVFESMSILQGEGKPDSSISADRIGREYWDNEKKQLYKYVETSSGVFEWIPSAVGTIEEVIRTDIITTSTDWIPPANMIGNDVMVTLIGGGGGIRSDDVHAGSFGGGGGGYITEKAVTLKDKNPVHVTIGAAGTKSSGGVTSFGKYASASGGGAGGGMHLSDYDTGGNGGSGGGGGVNQKGTSGRGGDGDFGGGGGGGGDYGRGGNGGTYGGGGGKSGYYGAQDGRKGGTYGGDGGNYGQKGQDGTDTSDITKFPGIQFRGQGKGGNTNGENGGGGGGYGGNGGVGGFSDHYGGGGGGGYGADGGNGRYYGGGGGGYGGRGDDGTASGGGGGGGYGNANYGKGKTNGGSDSRSGACIVRCKVFKIGGIKG